MNEVHIEIVDGGTKLRIGVQPPLLTTPIERGYPIVDQFAQVAGLRAVLPAHTIQMIGPSGASQALPQIRQDTVRNVDAEGLGGHAIRGIHPSDGKPPSARLQCKIRYGWKPGEQILIKRSVVLGATGCCADRLMQDCPSRKPGSAHHSVCAVAASL